MTTREECLEVIEAMRRLLQGNRGVSAKDKLGCLWIMDEEPEIDGVVKAFSALLAKARRMPK